MGKNVATKKLEGKFSFKTITSKFLNLKTKTKILIGICSPLFLLLVLGVVAVFNINSMVTTNAKLDDSRAETTQAAAIVASAVNMETGMRGYLLAGRDSFLKPYSNGETETYRLIEELKQAKADNPEQLAKLEKAEEILREWQKNVTVPTIALRGQIGDAPTMNDMAKLVGQAKGKVFNEKFRKQINDFIAVERDRLNKRSVEFAEAKEAVNEQFTVVRKTAAAVEYTQSILSAVSKIEGYTVEMQAALRGYLIGGNEVFKEDYQMAEDIMFAELEVLAMTVEEDEKHSANAIAADEFIYNWIEKAVKPVIALREGVDNGTNNLIQLNGFIGNNTAADQFEGFELALGAISQKE